MATVDFTVESGINSWAVSEYGDDAAFPPAFDGSEIGLIVKNQLSGGIYRYEVGLLSIMIEVAADATFNSLKFRFQLDSKTSTDGLNLLIAYYAYDGVAKADHFTTSPTSGAASVALSALTVGIVNEINLSNFAAQVPHTGRLGIRLALTATTPSGINAIALSSPVFRLDYSRPNAPDQLAIDGDASNGTGIIRTNAHDFTWVPFEGNGLSQSKYEVQWRTVGTPTWGASTTGVITSSVPLKTFASSHFANGNYEWRVQTTFSDNSVSPWSEIKTFTVGDAVTAPTLTAPSGVVTTGLPTGTWTSGVAGRDDWQFQVLQGSTLVYDTGAQPGTATSHPFVATYFQTALKRLVDHGSYTPRVRIRDGGIWSAWATGSFTVAFTRPASPTITAVPNHAEGYNLITITPGSGGATVESWVIFRSEGEKPTYDEIKTLPAATLTYKDRTAKHRVESTYRVQAIGTSGGDDYSLPASATLEFTVTAWLHSLDNPDTLALGFNIYNGAIPRTRQRSRAYPHFVGRTLPVTRRGRHKRREINVQLDVLHQENILDDLLALLDSDEPLCYRTNFQDRYFGDSPSDSINPDFGLSTVSFNFIENDHTEGQTGVETPSIELVGMTAYYSLEEATGTRVDSHGANNLTDINGVTQDNGITGKCAKFTRADGEYLSCADNAALKFGAGVPCDIDCWVKLTTKAAPEMTFISKNGTLAANYEYSLHYASSVDRFRVYLHNGTSLFTLAADDFGAPGTGIWYYIRFGWDPINGGEAFISVNGSKDRIVMTGGIQSLTNIFAIGAQSGGGQSHDGLIDEVGIRKRIRPDDEIDLRYNNGAGNGAYPF